MKLGIVQESQQVIVLLRPQKVQMKSLVLFASGKGSNAQAIIDYFDNTKQAQVSLIVCNNLQAGVLDIARKHNIPFLIVDKNTMGEALMITQIKEYKPDLIVLAGFLWKMPETLLQAFPDKTINIHPALLPKYGGKGMYGLKVHQAVKDNTEKETGITIHFVNEHYDEGAQIVQARCTITKEDTTESIAQKVAKLEHAFYPKTIEYLLGIQ